MEMAIKKREMFASPTIAYITKLEAQIDSMAFNKRKMFARFTIAYVTGYEAQIITIAIISSTLNSPFYSPVNGVHLIDFF